MKVCLRKKCGKEFEPNKPKQVFCSAKCRVYYSREEKTKPEAMTEKEVRQPEVVVQEKVSPNLEYDFSGCRFLIMEDWTKFPQKDAPADAWQLKRWNQDKKIADQKIRDAWNNRSK